MKPITQNDPNSANTQLLAMYASSVTQVIAFDPTWYTNLGGSCHVTSNLVNLATKTKSEGN